MSKPQNDIRAVFHKAYLDRYAKSWLLEFSMYGNIYVSASRQIIKGTFDKRICQIVIDIYPDKDPLCTGYKVFQVDDDEKVAFESIKSSVREMKGLFQKDLKEMEPLKEVLFDECVGYGKYILFGSKLEYPFVKKKTIYIKHRIHEGENPMKSKSVILDDGKHRKTYDSIFDMIKGLDMSDLMRLDPKLRDKVLR